MDDQVARFDERFVKKLRSDEFSLASEDDIVSTEAFPDEHSDLIFTDPSPAASAAAKGLVALMQKNNAKDLYINSASLEDDDLRNQVDFFKALFREFESRAMRIGFILPEAPPKASSDKKHSYVNHDLVQNIIGQTTYLVGRRVGRREFDNYLTSPAFIGFIKIPGSQQDFAQNAVNHFQSESSGNIFVYDSEAGKMAKILEADLQSPVKITATNVVAVQPVFFNLESCNRMIADITGRPADKSSETPSPSAISVRRPANLSSPQLNAGASGKGCCTIL